MLTSLVTYLSNLFTVWYLEREKMLKVLEDILTKKSKDTDVQSKEINASKLLMKNLKTLKKMAEKEGLSNSDIMKLMKNE